MFSALDHLLRHLVVHGDLTVVFADGVSRRYGDRSGQPISVVLRDRWIEKRLALDPQLALGEGYMDGRVLVRHGDIYDLLALVLSNAEERGFPAWTMRLDWLRYLVRKVAQFNPAARSRRNVAHHYDLPPELYDLFLDAERQYSCAYFDDVVDDFDPESIEQAQIDKMAHIAAKLAISPGHRVLDIGSGWGSLALYLARTFDADVTGITLSKEQITHARSRAAREAAGSRVRFDLTDYRALKARFDRIVSVGMFEHVGAPHFTTYFRRIAELLDDDGIALVHTIGRSEPPAVTNPFISRYIFPGGYIPALSEMTAAVEKSGLIVTGVEVLRLHYAWTLRAWRKRFLADRQRAVALKGEAFCRMWDTTWRPRTRPSDTRSSSSSRSSSPRRWKRCRYGGTTC